MIIRLLVQDHNNYGAPDSSREIDRFSSSTDALAAAKARVDAGLREFYVAGISAKEVFRQWSLFGEDVFLLPDNTASKFSAMEYARMRSSEISDQQ